MTTPDTHAALANLAWRYATKKFDPTKKIPVETWTALENSVRLSPSSFGLQPYSFVVVTDPAVRERLSPAAHGQPQIKDASHLVVFTARTNLDRDYVHHYIDLISAVRGVERETLTGLEGMITGFIENAPVPLVDWATRQAYLAVGFLISAAASLGIDTCPMEGFAPDQFDEILGLREKNLRSAVLVAAGYRAADDKNASLKKVRFPENELFIRV